MSKNYQLRAAYVLESVQKWINNHFEEETEKEAIHALLQNLSAFEAKSDLKLDHSELTDDPLLKVLHNLIIRGLPTWISFNLESEFAKKCTHLYPYEKIGSIGYDFTASDNWKDLFFRAMHPIEPRINKETAYENYLNSWEEHGSLYEERYLYKEISKWMSGGKGDYFIQLLEPQRTMESMVTVKKALRLLEQNFREQRTDFSIEFPYPLQKNGKKGVCIEIDGSQHNEAGQAKLDRSRDDALFESGWAKTLRLKTIDFTAEGLRKHFEKLGKLEQTHYFEILKKNYSNPLYEFAEGLSAMELILSPIAIARIQLSLVKSILNSGLSLESKKWRIAIIERDVACASMAVNDFKQFLSMLFQLEGNDRVLPEIELSVFNTPEFNQSVYVNENITQSIDELKNDESFYDLFIDISMLERFGLSDRPIELNFDHYIQIRSSHSVQSIAQILTSNRINWSPLYDETDIHHKEIFDQAEKPLTFFLNNLFRKKEYRAGQLPILNRALQNKTVIGLLPTGGGKSLTYQLASLLQPGHTIIIDPIKSLMKDQVDGLARIAITSSMYLNSSIKTFEEREVAMEKLKTGQALFCFVSPERMMIPAFRGTMESMYENGRYFSYAVIDEVHCVSEWGHDFRTPYLSLGRNLLEFCKSADGEIALFGLTATASYDVLSDVQRELSGNRPDRYIPDEAIIRHETTNRDELQMIVENVILSKEDLDQLKARTNKGWFSFAIRQAIGLMKQNTINDLLNAAPDILRRFNNNCNQVVNEDLITLTYEQDNQPSTSDVCKSIHLSPENLNNQFWDKSCENAALVFAPHRTWYFGVTDKYVAKKNRNYGIYENINRIKGVNYIAGTFMGADHEDASISNKIEEDNFNNQDAFLANKMNVMVATKAFGMGIDKPNIRFTVHASYPSSIESYIQEAGRAGRDKKLAVSTLVLNDQLIENQDAPGTFIDIDNDIQESFYNNSFKGEEKEKAIIYEILTEVTHPKRKKTYDLALKLNKDDDAQNNGLVFMPDFSPVYGTLFLDDKDGNKYGYLKVHTGEPGFNHINVGRYEAEKYLDKLWKIIQETGPVNDFDELKKWLTEEKPIDPTPGIEKVLETIDIEDHFVIVIPFVNDQEKVFFRLSGLLNFISKKFTPELCMECYMPDKEEFLKKLFKKINVTRYTEAIRRSFRNDAANLEAFYKKLSYALNSRRDKADTEKAIYRLSLIGVIDDYTIDYNAETYTIHGRKKTNEQYHEHLRNYINKYYSNRRTEAIINGLPDRRGDTEIQRILNFTIGFVYHEVAKKRKEAIKAMKSCSLVGLNQGNVEMKTWIHLYFNSKYARKDYQIEIPDNVLNEFRVLPTKAIEGEDGTYNASLLDWTDEGKESEFDWIIDFIHITVNDASNSQKNNLKHLRGACTRILIPNPDNFVLRLLRAYSVIVLDEDHFGKRQISAVSDDLETGFLSLWNYFEGDQKIFYTHLKLYQKNVEKQITQKKVIDGFRDHLEQILFLSHAEWVKKFNTKFIAELNNE